MKEEGNLFIWDHMDEPPWGHYAMLSKSDRERQTPCNLTYMQNLKTKTKNWAHRYKEQIGGCQRGWEERWAK